MGCIDLAHSEQFSEIMGGQVNTSPLSDALAGLGNKPRAARLLLKAVKNRNLALRAEADGVIRRADFRWREMYSIATTLAKRRMGELDEIAVTLGGHTGADLLAAATAMAPVAVALSLDPLDTRGAKLLTEAQKQLRMQGLTEPLSVVDLATFNLHERAGRIPEALAVAEAHIAEEAWAVPTFRMISILTASRLSDGSDPSLHEADLQAARTATAKLTELRQHHPHLLDAYSLQAELEAVQAVRFVALNRNHDGVVALNRARALNPDSDSLTELYSTIAVHVREASQQIENVAESARQRTDISLNAEGDAMLRDLRRAVSRLDDPSSSELTELQAARQSGIAHAFWRHLCGLEGPPPDDAAAAALLTALGSADIGDETAVRTALSGHPALAELDPTAVFQRLQTGPVADASSNEDQTLDALAGITDLNLPGASARRSGSEPFGAWWASSQGKFSKRLAMASLLFAGLAGGAMAYDSVQRTKKVGYLTEAVAAVKANDFETLKLREQDFRDTRIVSDYVPGLTTASPAFQEVESVAAAQERNRAVRTMNVATAAGETEIALAAAAHYFDHLGPAASDPRTGSMRDAYRNQMSLWLSGGFDPSSERHLKRLEAYQNYSNGWED